MKPASSQRKARAASEEIAAAKPLRLPNTEQSERKARRANSAEAPQFSRILVPVDFSNTSIAALRYAINFATAHNSELVLLYVVEPVLGPPGEIGYPGLAVSPVPNDYKSLMLSRLLDVRNREVRPGMKVDTRVRVGQAYNEIVVAARDLKADLIIIATHGRTGLKHVFLGSTAERVVRHATCPVLTVRKKS